MSADSKTEFLRIYRENINRTGAADLLAYLENETDFFTAPASTKHHGAHPGGLVEHSLNVYRNLRNITARGLGEQPVEGVYNLDRPVEETVAVLALLHDVCKALCYTMRKPSTAGTPTQANGRITRRTHSRILFPWGMVKRACISFPGLCS